MAKAKKQLSRSQRIEAAMAKAIEDSHRAGITDPDKISAAMQKARKEAAE